MTSEVTQALLPCPFCGGEADIFHVPDGAHAQCFECEANSSIFDGARDGKGRDSEYAHEDAFTAWNTRLTAQSGEGRSFEEMKAEEARIMQDWRWGNLTRLGVANHLRRAGFDIRYATDKANALEGEGRSGAGEDALLDALEAIVARKPYPERGDGEDCHRCAHCQYRWHDRVEERHGPGCAYVIARAALNTRQSGEREREAAIDDGLVSRFRSALRFAASRSVISSADEQALLAALRATDDAGGA